MGPKKFLQMSLRKSRRAEASAEFSAERAAADSVTDAIQALSKLMKKKKWSAVRRLFSSYRKKHDGLQFLRVPVFRSENPGDAETMLHVCLRHDAPLDIVREVVSVFPEALSLPDGMGRYPLHVAAECGASSVVISHLLEGNKAAASEQDCTGKTPLHLACSSSKYAEETIVTPFHTVYEQEMVAQLEIEHLDIVTHLAFASPSSVNMEDHDGKSPLEYAIEMDSPFVVVKVLQKLSERNWKKREEGADSVPRRVGNSPVFAERRHNQLGQRRSPVKRAAAA